ncbi:hypothetical protein [Miniphocaeibacter halophilus]|uniref:Uncharacterized protein n=1 Tax=Miniphocaeibacter halophilus TaxID=2931922 RepID=A0AC61MSN9_9FIRM|nr:hypothetical protein [Miniphocaeibacter halophilus]QQK08664.1 hypothetical protein JFY71_03740 [Miniphocaeibacter halophilus]
MADSNIMNIISIAFVAILTIYAYSKYDKRHKERKRLSKIEDEKICYLFSNAYVNILSINGKIPVPMIKDDFDVFTKIPDKSKGYIFEYTNVLELKYQYVELHALKKSVQTDEITSIYTVKPGHVYYIYGEDKNDSELSLKFKDITKETKIKKGE